MTLKPQTTCNEILEMILASVDEGKFLNHTSQVALDIFSEIDKLDSSDRDKGLELRAVLLHICGDLDSALRALDQRTHKNLTKNLNILTNYSRCAAAQELYAQLGDPRTGMFWVHTEFAQPIGAFRQVASFAREAERMHLVSGNADAASLSLEEIYMIDDVLNELGISDASAGKVMEVAGDVLAEHGFMFLGTGPEVAIINDGGEERAVHLTYRIAASATDAVSMYMKFVERLFYREIDMPDGFHISFGGSTS